MMLKGCEVATKGLQYPQYAPVRPSSLIGGAALICSGGRGFNSYPDQSFSLTLYRPNSITKVNTLVRVSRSIVRANSVNYHGNV